MVTFVGGYSLWASFNIGLFNYNKTKCNKKPLLNEKLCPYLLISNLTLKGFFVLFPFCMTYLVLFVKWCEVKYRHLWQVQSCLSVKTLEFLLRNYCSIFLRLNRLYHHCKEWIINTVISTMLPAPQRAIIVAITNKKLTITFMMTSFLFTNAKTMQT